MSVSRYLLGVALPIVPIWMRGLTSDRIWKPLYPRHRQASGTDGERGIARRTPGTTYRDLSPPVITGGYGD